MCIEKYSLPAEIQELHGQFAALMDGILSSIKNLGDAKDTTALPVARKKMSSVFKKADAVTKRLADYHWERYDAWTSKREELAEVKRFYEDVSAAK